MWTNTVIPSVVLLPELPPAPRGTPQALPYGFPDLSMQPYLWLLWWVCGPKLPLPGSSDSQNRSRKSVTNVWCVPKGPPCIYRGCESTPRCAHGSSNKMHLQPSSLFSMWVAVSCFCLTHGLIWGQGSLVLCWDTLSQQLSMLLPSSLFKKKVWKLGLPFSLFLAGFSGC